MTTALDIITDALNKLGVYSPGEPISSADTAQGLTTLNDMLDSWSNESLTTFQILENSFAVTPGIFQYTIGPGGAFNTTRPIRILQGPGTCYMLDSNGNRYNMKVVARDMWNLIGTVGTNINSNIPDTLFYDPQMPLGVINVFPTPNVNYTLNFDSYAQLSEFAALNSTANLPPGYLKAIKDNLAIELHPYFCKGQISPIIVEAASRSKGNVKRSNVRDNQALYDPEIVSRGSPTYNIYSDSYTI